MDWVTAGSYAFVGAVMLVLLWPTTSTGRRFLKHWGVRDASEEQVALAVRYLRNRRVLYPPLFLLAPLVLPTGWRPHVFVAAIAALLVAEAIGSFRPTRGLRVAGLTPRKWSDLVQRWAVVALVLLGLLAIGLAVAGLVAQPWADRVSTSAALSDQARAEFGHPVGWTVIVMVVLGLVEVLGIIGFAVSRTSVQDPQVDAVLRTRSARVGAGIGIAWMASAAALAHDRLTFLNETHAPEPPPSWLASAPFGSGFGVLLGVIGLAGWYWVANPGSKMRYAQSAT
ncbi:hypothetical protein JOF56_006535 [Kibdelosporangium banguiense]|uniref:Uncharacterized protein n=1 Tax=Kibdelosporangium banguiense TaxID=1365924 RepID=A0ABS4TQD5_9PSEU|nr:hypothetical protein [Kibdelosporangium banguiense]MBP2326150.1 hypothetical protein [Kibdelosporangium banguiense]